MLRSVTADFLAGIEPPTGSGCRLIDHNSQVSEDLDDVADATVTATKYASEGISAFGDYREYRRQRLGA